MTTATGTSRTGIIYAYYKCIQAIKQGRHREGNAATCANRKIPRPVIEKLVVDAARKAYLASIVDAVIVSENKTNRWLER